MSDVEAVNLLGKISYLRNEETGIRIPTIIRSKMLKRFAISSEVSYFVRGKRELTNNFKSDAFNELDKPLLFYPYKYELRNKRYSIGMRNNMYIYNYYGALRGCLNFID